MRIFLLLKNNKRVMHAVSSKIPTRAHLRVFLLLANNKGEIQAASSKIPTKGLPKGLLAQTVRKREVEAASSKILTMAYLWVFVLFENSNQNRCKSPAAYLMT